MNGVQPGMCLKVKADTFFLPDVDGSVYFRNNARSFRMDGASVQAWVEKLLPVLDGQHTMESLTEGLPVPYRKRIYDLAGMLYDNGFLRDVSADKLHQLKDEILARYAPQIEFVDNLVGSGARRFQTYRNMNILIVGAGSTLVSLVGALWESGLKAVNLIATDTFATNTSRLNDLSALYGDLADATPVHNLLDSGMDTESLRVLVKNRDAVLYLSETGDLRELRRIESVCRNEHICFMSAVCTENLGVVMPNSRTNVTNDKPLSFDAAWRRIHQSLVKNDMGVGRSNDLSGAVLANILVFELFKSITGVDNEPGYRIYTLNLETLEGAWHDVMPVEDGGWTGDMRRIENLDEVPDVAYQPPTMREMMSYFSQITDSTSGIFHLWGEGELSQLPLSQCRVQPIDPLSIGPAELLTPIVCHGVTHEDARREAGLTGIEAYVGRMMSKYASDAAYVGIGAGSTKAEAIGRGLRRCLARELRTALEVQRVPIRKMVLGQVLDETCQFYLQSMYAVGVHPVVGFTEDAFGFPVVWAGVHGRFVGSVGLCPTMALQHALAHALLWESRQEDADTVHDGVDWVSAESTEVECGDAGTEPIDIETWNGFHHAQIISAVETVQHCGCDVTVLDLAVEPFLNQVFGGVVGVSIGQGGAQ